MNMEIAKKVLISGGSGLLGRRLTQILEQEGYEVAWLSRRGKFSGQKVFEWDIKAGRIDEAALEWAGHILHLAGEGIADKRWTKPRKEELLLSRTMPGELLKKKIEERGGFQGRIICASAVGYYGATTSEHVFSETDESGSDFMADVCRKWEASSTNLIQKATGGGAILRIGIVLSADGGALPKLALPVKYYVGSSLGSGKQMIPWIHIDDVCRMFLHCLKNKDCKGIYNATGPQSVRHDTLIKCIGDVLSRPVFLPHVPEFVLKAMLGEMSVMVTAGAAVSSERIRMSGFSYLYPDLFSALRKELIK